MCKQIFIFLSLSLRLQTISVLMVALNILYLLVDETAMPKGSAVSPLFSSKTSLPTPKHTHTHAQNVNCSGAGLSEAAET